METPVLLISGTVGSGKTTVAVAVSEVLAERSVPHAMLDLDIFLYLWSSDANWTDLVFSNLAAVWPNYVQHGATSLVLAHVLEDAADLQRYQDAIPGAEITVCRLVAPRDQRVEWLKRRMQPGPSLDWHLARTDELEAILEDLSLEDFTVSNDERPVRAVALEVLARAGWSGRARGDQ